MCAKVAGNVAPVPPDEFYRALELTKAAVRDNLFLTEQTGPYNANVEPAKPSWPPAPELDLD